MPDRPHLTDLPSAVVGAGRVRVERVAAAVPRRRTPLDLDGWTAPELRAWLPLETARSRIEPPRRHGHRAVRDLNRLAGQLPTEAVLLGRAVADAAPGTGQPIAPALHDIVETYLPGSIDAYRLSAASGTSGARAEHLLVEQLRLLHEVTGQVLQAQADHDDQDLLIQADFLRRRFGDLRPGGGSTLDLPPAAPSPPRTPARERTAPAAPRGLATETVRSRHHLLVERDPVGVISFPGDTARERTLRFRLALPRGVGVTLGIVDERHTGATRFASKRVLGLRSGTRRRTGFRSPQIDMRLDLAVDGVRRFIVHATAPSRQEQPLDVALFVSRDGEEVAALPTVLARRRGAATTVIASGWDTTDGLFLRNESSFHADLRAACTAYGFDQVTWLSADTPAV